MGKHFPRSKERGGKGEDSKPTYLHCMIGKLKYYKHQDFRMLILQTITPGPTA